MYLVHRLSIDRLLDGNLGSLCTFMHACPAPIKVLSLWPMFTFYASTATISVAIVIIFYDVSTTVSRRWYKPGFPVGDLEEGARFRGRYSRLTILAVVWVMCRTWHSSSMKSQTWSLTRGEIRRRPAGREKRSASRFNKAG